MHVCFDVCRMLVRQVSTKSGVSLPKPSVRVIYYSSAGLTLGQKLITPASSDLTKTDWYWLQSHFSTPAGTVRVRLLLSAQSALVSGQTINYDSICVYFTSSTQGTIFIVRHCLSFFVQQ